MRILSSKEIREQTTLKLPDDCPSFLGHISPLDINIRIVVNFFPKAKGMIDVCKSPIVLDKIEEKFRKDNYYDYYFKLSNSILELNKTHIEKYDSNLLRAIFILVFYYTFLEKGYYYEW